MLIPGDEISGRNARMRIDSICQLKNGEELIVSKTSSFPMSLSWQGEIWKPRLA
jgi:hypothetical protein